MRILISLVFLLFFSSNSIAGNCLGLNVSGDATHSKDVFKLSETVQLKYLRTIIVEKDKGIELAANITCQSLTGASYTGSPEEWSQYFDGTFKALIKAGYKDLKVTRLGGEERLYKNDSGQEFILYAVKDENAQVIMNLAWLSQDLKTLNSISVSGNERIQEKIESEYKQLVNQINADAGKN